PGTPILPLDINLSEPEYTVEVVGVREGGVVTPENASPARRRDALGVEPDPAASLSPDVLLRDHPASLAPLAPRFGIRLGLKDVHGISDAEVRSILQARSDRPFTDVGDVLRRTALTRPV